jgi:ABC-type transport system involved in cytochrome c biogenesis permease subunit
MKKYLPWILLAVFAVEVLVALRPKTESGFHTREFGKLPVLLNGRVQPLDSVARNSLLQIRSTQTVPLEEKKAWEFWKHPKKLTATEWLIEVMLRPDLADERRTFLIHHPDLLSELKLENKGVENSGLHYFSFNELEPVLDEIQKQGQRVNEIDPQLRKPFEKQVMKLHSGLILYRRLKNSLRPETSEDFGRELEAFRQAVPSGVAAVKAQAVGKDYDKEAFERILEFLGPYDMMARFAYPLIVPPSPNDNAPDHWVNAGVGLMETARTGELHPAMKYYAAMANAYRQGNPSDFNLAVEEYRSWLSQRFVSELNKGKREFFYSSFQPFYRAMLIYLVAFLLGCASWFNWSEALRRSAFYLVVLAGIIHTAGLLARMFLEGRPPVTNLYSSALFIGWGAVVLGLILERIYRDGIGTVVASAIGFVTQIIAHNLALGGDTMEMLRAVLDTNFWLATHVVVITLGYASTFFAGFLAILYIIRGVFTRTLQPTTARSLTRMVYGIVCFATLFSFVGTILGGIWADQSWGRFWGWDPKENGALIIVLWNVVILHARWGGLVRERGLMNMAVFGNIVTSFSWFGVNMLGIGLHSYGFMDAAFYWLMLFVTSQLLIIGLGLLPARFWASFKGAGNVLVRDASLKPAGVPKPGSASAGV